MQEKLNGASESTIDAKGDWWHPWMPQYQIEPEVPEGGVLPPGTSSPPASFKSSGAVSVRKNAETARVATQEKAKSTERKEADGAAAAEKHEEADEAVAAAKRKEAIETAIAKKYKEAPAGNYRLGIDIGSKTIKLVLLDEEERVVYEYYTRHRSAVRKRLVEALHAFAWWFGDCEAAVAITGSAGISVAEVLGIPFVQEVVATTEAVKTEYPQADCVIELGGEDAKIIYLTGGLEQRMNASCAGGTGGFIETIAHLIGVRTRQMSSLALGASRSYPIASRCAVFAQTDVRPLLNAGASKADIAASALNAVVQQTLGGLACGRPVSGTVVFLGGPLEYQPALVFAFRRALRLTTTTGVKPRHAHLFTAKGAAIMGARMQPVKTIRVSELEKLVEESPDPEDDLEHLPALFESDEQLEEFLSRHKGEVMPRKLLAQGKPPFYLGLDAGSTSVKYALVDSDGVLVRSDYEKFEGDVLDTAVSLLRVLLADFNSSKPLDGDDWYIARAVVTGYGEDLLRAALRFDDGVVETTAHVRGARAFRPDVSFVLDIGGQDMKALWVRDGHVVDAVLNEACSSGCGAFVEGTARGLDMTPESFSRTSLEAKSPVDLGTKCTVFMNSRVKHAQKVGASQADLAAGVAYSVVKNALYRIIGRNKAAALGDTIVVQGGTFKSNAILRAFELVSGEQAIRPDTAHVMGAIGAALIGKDQVENGLAPSAPSNLLSLEDMRDLQVHREPMKCSGCENNCMLSVTTFEVMHKKRKYDWEQGRNARKDSEKDASKTEASTPVSRAYITGNKCERVWNYIGDGKLENASAHSAIENRPPNIAAVEQALIGIYGSTSGRGERGRCTIGLLNGINAYETTPFWHTLISGLGFSIRTASGALTGEERSKASESIPSESVCQPAKLLHLRSYELIKEGVDALFMPSHERGTRCPVASWYPKTLFDNLGKGPQYVCPQIHSINPERIAKSEDDRKALFEALKQLAEPYEELKEEEFANALEAGVRAQQEFYAKIERATEKALAWVEADSTRRGVVLAGRPYHMDKELLHGIDEVLARLGVAVIPAVGLKPRIRALRESDTDVKSVYWKPAKHLMRTAAVIEENPSLEIVALVSFNCGYDAVSFDEARAEFARMGKPFTELKIDDIFDTAHIRIRLRTLVEGMQYAQLVAGNAEEGHMVQRSKVGRELYAGTLVHDLPEDDPAYAPHALDGAVELDFNITDEDVATARAHVTSDLCFTAAALAAHAGNLLNANPDIPVVRVPRVCEQCLVDSLPFQVSRICEREAGIAWQHYLPAECVIPDNSAVDPSKPLIGIVGNPLLCFSEFMNERVARLIENLGCQVYWPDPENLFTDDVRYLPQMDEFQRAGVRHVIYLQSFGCLKGHVRSRGALRELARLYPDIAVTVLDYDPETSALNRENRIRLALHAALNPQDGQKGGALHAQTDDASTSGDGPATETAAADEKPRKMPPYDIQEFKDNLYTVDGRWNGRFGLR